MTTAGPADGTTAVLVELADATFAYGAGAPALEHVTISVAPGDALALIGPNGAGKSTLLAGLLGLVPVVSGRAAVLGGSARAATGRVGYMPQTDEIDPDFPVTLRQVVMMGRYHRLGAFRLPGRRDREAVAAAIERVGLTPHAGGRFGALSGGQQQRGILARALVAAPRLLLLDEPFNGLDRTSRERLVGTLRELRADGVGIVVSTHDLELARDVCSHVLLVDRCQIAAGPIDATLTPENLRRTFEHASADGEAHGHHHLAHGHDHDTGFRGVDEPPHVHVAIEGHHP
ncbi:manganese/iron transport system ATP-binding protein [Pseudoclavibacter chungangensis]|nr:metal ABC transporter ATP-binding protein [Pseudoclavibacter chungangensis]NYJ68414.1 manganese/iron transport system ATP-binding protein [Pseudoclavibacter chungangensis]